MESAYLNTTISDPTLGLLANVYGDLDVLYYPDTNTIVTEDGQDDLIMNMIKILIE